MGVFRACVVLIFGGVVLHASPLFAESSARTAAPCSLSCPSLQASGCGGGFKCVSSATCQPGQAEIQGECQEAFTIAEVVAALPPKVPAGYSVPYTSLLCESKGAEGWGMRDGMCLPSCQKLGQMWAGTVSENTPGWQDSYVQAKPSFNCANDSFYTGGVLRCKQGPVTGVYDFPKTDANGVRHVCCQKICDKVPTPFDYLTQYPAQPPLPQPPASGGGEGQPVSRPGGAKGPAPMKAPLRMPSSKAP